MAAYQSLNDVYVAAEKSRTLFEAAGLQVPPVVSRVLGMNGTGGVTTIAPKISAARIAGGRIPPPPMPSMPPEAKADWVGISIKDALAQSVAIALLRQAAAPLKSKELIKRVQTIAKASVGGIYN